MVRAMSPKRRFSRGAPLVLGPVPDIDDLEVLELDVDNVDSEAKVVFNEGVAVFNIDEDAADPQGTVDDPEASCSGVIAAKGSAEPAVTHFAIGTPGSSPCSTGAASLAGSGSATPVSSDRSSADGLQQGFVLQKEAPRPEELLEAVTMLQSCNHAGSEDLVEMFGIDAASDAESDDDE